MLLGDPWALGSAQSRRAWLDPCAHPPACPETDGLTDEWTGGAGIPRGLLGADSLRPATAPGSSIMPPSVRGNWPYSQASDLSLTRECMFLRNIQTSFGKQSESVSRDDLSSWCENDTGRRDGHSGYTLKQMQRPGR